MDDAITITRATPDDVATVADIEERTLGLWSAGQFVEELAFDRSWFLVARYGGVMAGFIIAWLVVDEFQILSLAVDGPFRRRGIARALVQALASAAPTEARVLFLEVAAANADARAFYRVMGFDEVGVRKQFYGSDDAILMRKSINA